MSASAWSKNVAAALFQEADPKGVFAEAYYLIEYAHLHRDDSLLNLMAEQSEPEIVARITLARTVHAPHDSVHWLRYLLVRVFGTPSDTILLHPRATGNLVIGVVHGLFASANWLDKTFGGQTEFNREFPARCALIIIGKNKPQQEADRLKLDSKYVGELTNVIKAYAKGQEDYKGMRMGQLQEIMSLVSEYVRKQKDVSSKDMVGATGNLILDQLTYPLFNQLSPCRRAQALADWFNKLLDGALSVKKPA